MLWLWVCGLWVRFRSPKSKPKPKPKDPNYARARLLGFHEYVKCCVMIMMTRQQIDA